MNKSDPTITIQREDIRYFLGNGSICKAPRRVYSDVVCSFLDELSEVLRRDRRARQYPDVLTFAFWCRRSNIQKLKKEYMESLAANRTVAYRVGRGLVFHVAPSNVPVNFAFSFAFGLLAGCSNVVRVSGKDFPQTELICDGIRQVLQQEKYAELYQQNQIISYGHQQEINDLYSSVCDARVIWGGDAAIQALRQSPVPPQCVEIVFADRYSFAVLSEREMSAKSEEALARFASDFYNDTYLMDQNACSSPHLIVWLDAEPERTGRKRFWEALWKAAEKYDLPGKKVMDKYTMLCEQAATLPAASKVTRYGNRLYVMELSGLPEKMDEVRGIYGLFYETEAGAAADVAGHLTNKVQTCLYDGVDPQRIADAVIQANAPGIDRIVPVGKAMDIGVHWDGYDIIGVLSREMILS